MNSEPVEQHPRVQRLRTRAESDPNVVGLVLTGSQARLGMANEHSDIDVYVVLERPDDAWRTERTPEMDVPVTTLDDLRTIPGPENQDGWWSRYSFTHSVVLLDRLGGGLTDLVEAWGSLTEAEAYAVVEAHLDGYINWAYRSLKSNRDGRQFEARLDAVESLGWGLTVIFALQRRVRPYNKYLRWELENHPLTGSAWQGEHLIELIDKIMRKGKPGPQRDLFWRIEADARSAGHGPLIDAWGDELRLFHDATDSGP